MTTAATPEPTSEEIQRGLRLVRRLRHAALLGLGVPVVVTASLVGLNRLTDGALRFFVNGDPWTHWFWNTLFVGFVGGAAILLLSRAVRCPRCGNGFHVQQGYHPMTFANTSVPGARFGVNVFSRRCLNCGLHERGPDFPPSPPRRWHPRSRRRRR